MVDRIIFIRHPRTLWNDVKDPEDQDMNKRLMGHTNIKLDAVGRRQAEAVACYLSSFTPDKIFSSPLFRAKDTAKMISRATHKSVSVLDDLKEINFGHCEGMTFQSLQEKYPETYADYVNHAIDIEFPGGESLNKFRRRVYKFVDKLITEKGIVVVVTHGGVIRVALCHLLGVHHDFIWNVHLDYGSSTELFSVGNTFVISKVNHIVPWQK